MSGWERGIGVARDINGVPIGSTDGGGDNRLKVEIDSGTEATLGDVAELLSQLLAEQRLTNFHLSLITGAECGPEGD